MPVKCPFINLIALGVMLSISSCTAGSRHSITNPTTEEIKIGGSSEAYPVLKVLADAYEAKVPGSQIAFLPASITSGAVQGVKDNVIDIGAISRELSPEENSNSLESRFLVKNALAIAIHESVEGVTNLDKNQLKAIYSGAINNWEDLGGPDAEITLLDLSEDESEKQILRQHYLGQKLKITPTAITFSEGDELIEAVGITSYSMGTVPLEETLTELPLNIISINGIAPTKENLENGRYQLILGLGIVFPSTPSTSTQNFLDFIFSGEGKQALLTNNYIVFNAEKNNNN